MENIQTLINDFAKANKISKSKLEAFTDSVKASILSNIPQKESKTMGRPVLEATSKLYQAIIEKAAIPTPSLDIKNAVGVDSVRFNNAVAALIKQGKLFQVGKAQTGKRGRQPFILSSNKPE